MALIGVIALWYFTSNRAPAPATAATPSPTKIATPTAAASAAPSEIPPAAATPPAAPTPPPLDESAFHGTRDSHFGPDWVILNGTKLQGISSANPAPNGEVALLFSDSGKNVPASSLPQGFLDEWNLTPDRLKAANKP